MPSHPVSTLCSRFFWLAIIVLLAAAPDPARAMPGEIYVSHCCGDINGIDRVTPGESVTVFATSGSSELDDPVFDTAGNLFVLNYSNNTIDEFTPNGVARLSKVKKGAVRWAIVAIDRCVVTSAKGGYSQSLRYPEISQACRLSWRWSARRYFGGEPRGLGPDLIATLRSIQ